MLALVPQRPATITAAEIANKLHMRVEVDNSAFVKTIRRKLVDLERGKVISSVRLGGRQLGWHIVG